MRGRLIGFCIAVLTGVCAGADGPAVPALHNRITVDYHGAAVTHVLKDLGDKTGVRFASDESVLAGADLVTYAAQDKEAGRVATRILRPLGLTYKTDGETGVRVVKLDPLDEFRVKAEPVFEFAEKPVVTRQGDRIAITFATKGWCDVTLAIEDKAGKIVRHLASGVLGENAPEPFQWNSKKQAIVWDGKDDRGIYVDDKDSCTIRVSLGLKPQYERTLYWSPFKRLMQEAQPLAVCAEGVLVYDGTGVDRVLLFDHDAKYKRTIYPFPADKLDKVVGLTWDVYPQDGKKLPRKQGCQLATLLTSGQSSVITLGTKEIGGTGVSAMAVAGDQVIVAQESVNRLAMDGSSGGLPLKGGRTTLMASKTSIYPPYSVAISPDRKWLYMACYGRRDGRRYHCRGEVQRLALEGDAQPERFVFKKGQGGEPRPVQAATSVDCDGAGNVYVTDYLGDCVQVFAPDGAFLKNIPVSRPAVVRVDRRSGDVYCFSWYCYMLTIAWHQGKVEPKLHHFKGLPDPTLVKTYDLPLPSGSSGGAYSSDRGYPIHTGEIDFGADALTVWIGRECRNNGLWGVAHGDGGSTTAGTVNALVFREKEGKLQLLRDFGKEAVEAVYRADPTDFGYARLYVNPRTGKLYVKENRGASKQTGQLIEVNPSTGRVRGVKIPMGAEDICFDTEGNIYLRGLHTPVARFDFVTSREVPWDYGEQQRGLASVLPIPGAVVVCYHEGGLHVNARGNLVVSGGDYLLKRPMKFGKKVSSDGETGEYHPLLFPGRGRWQSVHIWDKHGKLVQADVFPGTTILDGVALDNEGDLYVMTAPSRRIKGKPVVSFYTETLIKAKPGRARVLTAGRAEIPLSPAARPKRPMDLSGQWVQGAEWMYGGVGYGGFNGGPGGGCACWHARFCLDQLARSFAPEIGHHSVAVLDSNGNLILRVGQYGNVDDGVPLIKDGGPPNPRPIGGDEVGLFYPQFVATHSDRRLFISDTGNARIVSVKLGYHAEEKIALKGIPDTKEARGRGNTP